MKRRIISLTVISIWLILIGFAVIYPNINQTQSKKSVDLELQDKLEDDFSTSISIITVTEHDDMKGYSTGASGVIIDKKNNIYYALTAYHVVANRDSYLILTTLDETLSDYREKNRDIDHTSVDEYYGQLPEAQIEYLYEESDLAIISFEYDDDLKVASISENLPAEGDNIVVVGTLEGDFFEKTYGTITDNKLTIFKTNDDQSENKVIKHNAYVAPGSSGGGVYNSNKKLVGINIGGGTDIFGRFKYGAMIPYNQIQECINKWKKSSRMYSFVTRLL